MITGNTGSHYNDIKGIIDPIIDGTNGPLSASDKEKLKEKIANAVDKNLDFYSSNKVEEKLNKNITNESKTKEQLPSITEEVAETVEEYSDLMKEFGDIDVHELFRSDPRIEEIAENYHWETTGKREFCEALLNNPGALAGFIMGLQLLSSQIKPEEKKTSLLEKTIHPKALEIYESLPGPAQAAVISAISALSALKEGNYKLAAAHCIGIYSIAFCSSFDNLFEKATVSVVPGSEVVFEAMAGLEKLKE